MARKKIGEILRDARLLEEGQLQRALREQQRWGGPIGRILVDLGMISEDALINALSHQLNFPVIALDEQQVPARVASLVPGDFAEEHGVIPFRVQGKFLDVAMVDPTNLGIVDELRIRTQLNIRSHLAGPKAIERALHRVYGRGVAGAGPAIGPGQKMIELDLESGPPGPGPSGGTPAAPSDRNAEILALQRRLSDLEAVVKRDEDVLRKLLRLLIDKGVASREEILEKIK